MQENTRGERRRNCFKKMYGGERTKTICLKKRLLQSGSGFLHFLAGIQPPTVSSEVLLCSRHMGLHTEKQWTVS